jgi:pimeloyl-ACP methyl ester carboxylesterase
VVVVALGLLIAVYVLAVVALGVEFGPVKPRPTNDRDRYASVLGSSLAYRVAERPGPTLILLHGFGGSLLDWEAMLPKLQCARVVTVDLLGFGASSRPAETYDLETHRRHVIGLMDALGIAEAVLVGGSFGASLTLWTAAYTPNRIIGAVAMAPSGMPGQLQAAWPRSFLFKPGAANSIASALVRSSLFRWMFGHSQARQALGISGSYGPRFATAMPKIKQPTLLFWSPGDRTAPYAYRDRYLQAIPQAKLITFKESSGHGLAGEEPERAAQHICEFVAELARADSARPGLPATPSTH